MSSRTSAGEPLLGAARPTVLQAPQSALLNRLHGDAAAHFGRALDAMLADVHVTPQAFSETTYDAAMSGGVSLPFAVPEGPAGLLACSPALISLILDQVLGCGGMPATSDDGMSELTRHLLYVQLAALLPAYAEAWAPHAALPFAQVEPTPIPADTPVFLADYAVCIPHGQGLLRLLLLLPSWTATLDACTPAPAPPPALPLDSPLLQAIGDCPVPVRALFGGTTISVQELVTLQPGDIICLDQRAEAPVEVRLGNGAALYGQARVDSGRYQITMLPDVSGGSHGSE